MPTFADNLYEYVAYVVNGLIGRKSVKQMFRQMTYHDMFTPNRNKFRIKNLVDEFEYPAVSMSTANTYARQVIDSMPLDRQLKVKRVPRHWSRRRLDGLRYVPRDSSPRCFQQKQKSRRIHQAKYKRNDGTRSLCNSKSRF